MYNPQLDTFLRVADAGSFNKAAEEAYITPTAVIKQINLLEDHLEVKLFELSRTPICCAVSLNHPLAAKDRLKITDLYGENLMLMHRGWSKFVDELRDDLWANQPEIHIVDFDFYNVNVFNQCENSNDILMVTRNWENIHPLLKIIPVEWDYTIPFGLLYSSQPSRMIQQFLSAVQAVMK